MKSQDIFILLKLVSLEQQARVSDGYQLDPFRGLVMSDCEVWNDSDNVIGENLTQSISEAY